MLKFVSHDIGGVASKRNASRRSCDPCRKSHKRCLHVQSPTVQVRRDRLRSTPTHEKREIREDKDDETSTEKTQRSDIQTSQPPVSTPANRVLKDDDLRFIGNLNPEASFIATRNSDICDDGRRSDIGIWLGHGNDETAVYDDFRPKLSLGDHIPSTSFPLPTPFGHQEFLPSLQMECVSVLPPDDEFSFMSNVFFSKFYPILPILHEEDLQGLDNIEETVLKQCVCLIASLDPSLKSHLKLPHANRVLSAVEFRSCVATALESTLYMGVICDKIVLLQVSVLMAFYVNKPSSSEISSFYCAQAVHLAQTLGLHLCWSGEGKNSRKARRIFWCVWTLDRLNAATNGRPTLLHDRDMDQRVFSSLSEQIPPFRLFIRICQCLDEVISCYRPHQTLQEQRKQREMPDFEVLVHEENATEVKSPILASLELVYLAVLILQSRPQSQPDIEHAPSSSDIQSFCATSIISITSKEFKYSMTFWAALPYAVSLATSVSYQSLRNSNIPYTRNRAITTFNHACDVLDGLSKTFRSAHAMARLAKDTLHEVERVFDKQTRSQVSGVNLGSQPYQGGEPSDPELRKADFGTTLSKTTLNTPNLGLMDIAASEVSDTNGFSGEMNSECPIFDDIDLTNFGELCESFGGTFDLHRTDTLFSATLNPGMPVLPEEWYNLEITE